MEANAHLIIVAGGTGSRMKSDIPKQYMEINHKTILEYTIEKFITISSIKSITVAVSSTYLQEITDLLKTRYHSYPIQVIEGGETRFNSVKNALKSVLASNGVILVHDAARPMISKSTIERIIEMSLMTGNAVPFANMNESVRLITDNGNQILNRDLVKIIQTPQAFEINLMRKAFETDYKPEFTDDASVIEVLGIPINLVEGNEENIKITTPKDLEIFKTYLND